VCESRLQTGVHPLVSLLSSSSINQRTTGSVLPTVWGGTVSDERRDSDDAHFPARPVPFARARLFVTRLELAYSR
jgi:hypothetical protein